MATFRGSVGRSCGVWGVARAGLAGGAQCVTAAPDGRSRFIAGMIAVNVGRTKNQEEAT